MGKLRIGLVDLDTSHPVAWLPIIRELGHDVVAVYDGGTVHPQGYAQEFAAKYQVANVCDKLEDMVDQIDLAIIHSCNWDLHVPRAVPFIAAGKGVLLDKPMVGNLADYNQLIAWERQGAKVLGGSALRYASVFADFLASLDQGEEIRYVYTGTGVDEFNYGIHGYSSLQGLLGSGIQWVRHLDGRSQHQIELSWKSGARAILTVGKSTKWLPFWATVITDRRAAQLSVANGNLYKEMLEKVLPYFAGETPAPAPLAELLEGEKAAMAARLSWQNNNTIVYLDDVRLDDAGYDGAAFGESYRLARMAAAKK